MLNARFFKISSVNHAETTVAMTVLMPSWYYEKRELKRSPSILDGLDVDRESRYRREGARFIINVGTKMGLRYDTMATGVVYFHRFYMFHSFKTFPRYVTACCCLFLAGKVEETPKKCKDIIRIAKTFLADSQLTQFGDDPKEEVMTLERILLQTIKFDLQVDHPYGHLLKYAKSLKGDKQKLQNMVQMAWTFINDSLCTTLCLQFEPEVIAIALMYLAGKLSKFEVVDWIGRTGKHSHWWDMFVDGMSVELLEDICHQVLDLYSTPMSNPPQDSPPATPPTKSSRKSSQPPSPVEISTSPAQVKAKDVVGLPIPRLEPGDLKRKSSVLEPKKEFANDSKVPRIAEGKAIPTITGVSPKANISTHDQEPLPPSPKTPVNLPGEGTSKARPAKSEPAFRSGISSASQAPFTPTVPSLPAEAKPVVPPKAATFPPAVPPTAAQPAPPFFPGEGQPFPNLQQPPPQMFPMQFQHPPPPPVTPSSLQPPPNFPALPPGAPPPPPFSSHYPPPPRQPPPLLGPPPPAPMPGMSNHPPPRPPGMRPVPPPGAPPSKMDGMFAPRPDMYAMLPDQRGRPSLDRRAAEFGARGHYDGDSPHFRGRRDMEFDGPFALDPTFDPAFPRPPQFGQSFERQGRAPPPRRFPMDHKRGPRPPMDNGSQQQSAPTGIAPVRITGSL